MYVLALADFPGFLGLGFHLLPSNLSVCLLGAFWILRVGFAVGRVRGLLRIGTHSQQLCGSNADTFSCLWPLPLSCQKDLIVIQASSIFEGVL